MSFLDDLDDEEGRNSPVRQAVKANAVRIQEGRDAGKKLSTIFRALKKKGENVGAGCSSFRNAVIYLDKHGWPETASVPASPPAASERDRFVDNRHDSDF